MKGDFVYHGGRDGEDYTDMVINDMYEILTTMKNPFPDNYTKLQKVTYLDKVINYLKENEEYEMCKELENIKQRVINERVVKIKKNKRK